MATLPVAFAGFHFAAQFRAVLNGYSLGLQFALDASRAPDLYPLLGRELSFGQSAQNDLPRRNFSLDRSVGSNGNRRICESDLAFNGPVDEEVLSASHFAFNLDSLANACGSFLGYGRVY